MKLFSRYGFFLLFGIAAWILFLVYQFSSTVTGINVAGWQVSALYAAFLIFNMLFLSQVARKIEKWKVFDLLWYLVVTGVAALAVAFAFQVLFQFFEDHKVGTLIKPIADSIAIYSFVIFTGTGIFLVRKLIFYQKTKKKVIFWRVFEVVLLIGVAMLFDPSETPMPGLLEFTPPEPDPETGSTLAGIVRAALVPIFFVISLVLATNVNWSAYLTFNQKLKSIFLIFVITVLFAAYLYSFPSAIFGTSNGRMLFDIMLTKHIVFGFIFYFPLIYLAIAGLVLIFNLPTSSVFERRSSEITSFQQISQFLQSDFDREKILVNLLDAGVLISNSTCGWFEYAVGSSNGSPKEFGIGQMKAITEKEILDLEKGSDLSNEVIAEGQYLHIRNVKKHKSLKPGKSNLRTILAIPVVTRKSTVGVLYVGNTISNAYEEDMIQSLVALADQAAIGIENARLLQESIATERYQKELRIAREVQEQILPKSLPNNGKISIHAVAQDAEEIGGDFYDVSEVGSTFYKVALGDVSGKGTTAAFYMAETKGIFQALTGLQLSVRDFLIRANDALSRCFNLGSFMTMTFLHIDLTKSECEILRAGHTPTLYYKASEDKLSFLEGLDGMTASPGLGIIRDGSFGSLLPEARTIKYERGDFMVLYTDGIIEARSPEGEEFGFEHLHEIVYKHRHEMGAAMPESVLAEVKKFAVEKIDDDYTILVIRFL